MVKDFATSDLFDNLMMLCVFLNTVVLSLDGLVQEEELLNTFNFWFTIIFAVELGLKIIGLGVKEYIRDTMNVFDAIVVILSIVELIFLGGGQSGLSAFRVSYFLKK